MPEHRGNNAGRTSRGWRDRIRPRGGMSGPRMFLAWLLFAMLIVAGFVIGLVFLVLGWILLPLLRYGLIRKMAGGRGSNVSTGYSNSTEYSNSRSQDGLRVIEGEYEIKERRSG